MKNYISIRNKLKSLIDKDNLYELEAYVNDEEIELKYLNDKYFDIINYACSLYDKGKISSKLKDFIVFHYDNRIVRVVEIINDDNLNELKSFTEKNGIKFKDLNYRYFDIINYSEYLLKKYIISNSLYDYILMHFNDYTERENVIKIMKKNSVNELKNYMEINGIQFKELNDDYFDIVQYASSSSNNISYEVKKYIIHHFDRKRNRIIKYIKSDNISGLMEYIEKNDIEFRDLSDKYFDIIDYVNSSTNYISGKMKWFIISHYYKERYQVIELIRRGNVKKLIMYIKENEIELEALNDEHFDILRYVRVDSNRVTMNMKVFVLTHLNKKRSDLVEIIRKNDLYQLKKYIKTNDIELKDYNDEYFDIIRYGFSLYDQNIIYCSIKDYMIISFTKKRRQISEIIKRNDLYELKKFTIENNFKLEELNDQYFDIVKYTCSYLFCISLPIKNFIKEFHNKEKSDVILTFIKKNYYQELKIYVEYTNPKFCFNTLNTSYFNLMEYISDLYTEKEISMEMKNLILYHYDSKRYEVLKIINNKNDDKDKFVELKNYVNENKMVFSDLDDQYFNFKDYCIELYQKEIISNEIKLFIFAHYDKTINNIITLIHDNNLIELKKYTTENDIEFKDFDNEHFALIKYCILTIKPISPEIINYIMTHSNKSKGNIIDLMKTNDLSSLKNYINDNKIKITDLNNDRFDIIKYTNYLYKTSKISDEIKDYIILYFHNN